MINRNRTRDFPYQKNDRFGAKQMKDEKYLMDENKRRKKRLRLRRRRINEEGCEKTQIEEKKRIQKDKILDEEEAEEKEQEEENGYREGKDEEKDYKYYEVDEKRTP
jgi:hypothetical protein